jgi:AcrR family transcriptional regulator
MPYPSRIDKETIVNTARSMIEVSGVDNLSLHKLARELGVKAPSLYRYLKNKTELLRSVNDLTNRELFKSMRFAIDMEADAKTRLIGVARAYREFAHENPITYGLFLTNTINELRPKFQEGQRDIFPFHELFTEIAGEENARAAMRGALGLIHGWVMLEISHQYQKHGNIEEDFIQAVSAYLEGWHNPSS